MSTRFTAAAALLAMAGATPAAEPYPTRPIRLVVGYPAGGSTDIGARMLGQRLSSVLGQSVVIDNRAGAGGTIGAALVAKSEPDGHTLGFSASAEVAISRATMKSVPFDVLTDFLPITLAGRVSFMLVVPPGLPVNSVRELIDMAKAQPGKMNFASFGNGTSNHLAGELFRSMAGINIVHVPYKGSAPAIADLLGGHVQMTFDTITVVHPLVRAGKLKGLAVSTPVRSPLAPELPTVDESGLKGFTGGTWFGLLAPAKTSAAVVDRLNAEVVRILRAPDTVTAFLDRGIEPAPMSPREFRTFIDAEIIKWVKVARDAGIKPE